MWGLRDHCGALSEASVTTFPYVSLFTKGDDSGKTATAQCFFDRNVLGIFVPLPPAVLLGFTHEANIALDAFLAKISFSVLCSSCFTHGNKAP